MDQPDFLISLHFQFSLLDCRDDSLSDKETVPFDVIRQQEKMAGPSMGGLIWLAVGLLH